MFQRGQSCGGGYSSLGYLFGGDDKPRVFPKSRPLQQSIHEQPVGERECARGCGRKNSCLGSSPPVVSPEIEKPAAGKVFHDEKDTSEGRMGRTNNNYHRVDGQNCGNFITKKSALKLDVVKGTQKDRPSTRVQESPGGQSSLGYLFGRAGYLVNK